MKEADLRRARSRLRDFLAPMKAHLGRREVQSLVETYVAGLMSDAHKKNAEAIAWEVGEGRVRALQRLLTSARWDEAAVVDRHQQVVTELFGSDNGILIVDDTGFRKKGVFSCGVGRQYSGTLGKRDNCQVGVFLSYAVPETYHTLLDRRLYLQQDWFTPHWAEQRARAHVPDDAVFRTKGQLALEMLDAAIARGVPHSWINMDAGYGEAPWFLDALHSSGERYAAAVPEATRVWTERPATLVPKRKGRRGPRPTKLRLAKGAPPSRTAKQVAANLPLKAFESAILRDGEKGPIRIEVAALRVWNSRDKLPGREEWLVVIRRLGQQPETKYILSNASDDTPRMEIAYAGLARWTEEQCFEQGKDDLGLSEYQTKTWTGWMRHTALVMLAHAFLINLKVDGEKRTWAGDGAATALRRRTGT
jgi:SRSO17 transposase